MARRVLMYRGTSSSSSTSSSTSSSSQRRLFLWNHRLRASRQVSSQTWGDVSAVIFRPKEDECRPRKTGLEVNDGDLFLISSLFSFCVLLSSPGFGSLCCYGYRAFYCWIFKRKQLLSACLKLRQHQSHDMGHILDLMFLHNANLGTSYDE
ncbi:hypothetical protein B0T24DRAFT_28598 [Lasiosphaeria ovina]|uniref:Uncharacterized protein n=1 Tax=Lasiosphaeria ovina TaxID=92902 RepID=A0AAE0NJY3_9PEZI|nr:hypothetical protein B0T24DRAFT_28598 [Lasiosphaeria ovina]